MGFKIVLPCLVFLISANAQCADLPVVTDPISAHLSPIQNLKGYALTVCFGDGFPADKTLEKETVLAARFYIEKGAYPIEAYNETAELANAFLKKNYLSEKGEKWTAMKCIDLFYSKELDKLVQKYEKDRIATSKRFGKNLKK